ncbi:hypothetical protein Vau01_115600 [Virgisporangium aurantiacum]|uniref:Uncharacterized protein n=1 Tax=Virgisporangium aurantiacum TaxID=175570 RepID=A0A8J4E791_9ACTN|nr:hypothetical protein Vau01_115600 [Virgisporangium aurantiacum]
MRRRAEDPDPAGGVFDDGQHVQPRAVRVTVSKKSAAMIASAWPRRNVAHVVAVRSGAGSVPASLRISQTVDAATRIPRVRSSPWMRLYPHELFSRASRR